MFLLPQFQFSKWRVITSSSAAAGEIVTYDPYFNYTTLLINAESTSTGSGNTTFIDVSPNNYSITRTGDVVQSSINPFGPNDWSFLKTNNYSNALIPAGVDFAYGLSAFTIEAWINADTFSNSPIIYSQTVSGTNYFVFQINTSGQLQFIGTLTGLGTAVVATSGFVIQNKWNHVTLVREGSGTNQLKFYINGILAGMGTTTVNLSNTTYNPSIGGHTYSTVNNNFRGYISNLRVVKGQALYTGNFTPSVSALSRTSIGATGNNVAPSLTGTVSLLTCQSNRLVDNSTSNKSITANTSTTSKIINFHPFSKYTNASNSVYFNAASIFHIKNSRFYIPRNVDYTFEAWIYPTATPDPSTGSQIAGCYRYGFNGDWLFSLNPNLTLQLYVWSSPAFVYTSQYPVSFNSWNHVCLTRSGSATGNSKMYINGMLAASGTHQSHLSGNGTYNFSIGGDNNNGTRFTGYISNVRMVSGQALYTGDFTPPSNELKNNTVGTSGNNVVPSLTGNVVLLACQDPVATIDNSVYAASFSRQGTPGPIVTKNTPFLDVNLYYNNYTTYFNGSASLIVPRDTALIPADNTDFTIESWIYPTQTPDTTTGGLIMGFLNEGSNSDWFLRLGGSVSNPRSLFMNMWNGSGYVILSSGDLTLNTWNHVAITRSGTGSNNTKLFVNGLVVSSASNNRNLTGIGSNNLCIGTDTGNDSARYTGYISDVRMVSGQALYTGDFTPSTAPLTLTNVGVSGSNVATSLTGNVVLLTCKESQFVDISNYRRSITTAGTPVNTRGIAPFTTTTLSAKNPYNSVEYSPITHIGSIRFDGNSYLTSNAPRLSGDYTLECWFYKANVGDATLFHAHAGSSTGTWIRILTNRLVISDGASSSTTFNAANAPIIYVNQWNHIAFVRSGSITTVYFNGKNIGTSNFVPQNNNKLNIGNHQTTAGYEFDGYIADVRLVNGDSTIYTTDFTPPTAALSAVPNTTLLLRGNNATIFDATCQHPVTVVGSVSAITTNPKYGKKSLFFNGLANNYLAVSSNLETLSLSTGTPFTIECWAYPFSDISAGSNFILSKSDATGLNYTLLLDGTTNFLTFQLSGTNYSANTTLTVSAWNHIAVTYDGSSNLGIFKDGTRVSSYSGVSVNTPNFVSPLIIGNVYTGTAANAWRGYLDDIRITKGINRYSGLTSFTIPASAFPTQ